MRIVVTPRDANTQPVSKCCPIAQSLLRSGFQAVTVTPEYITWWSEDNPYAGVPTPPVAAEWIERYDNHHHVGPFSFELPGVTV